MPPKSKYTKEEIANEALELIRENGYGSLNARSLANRLGISTMPLFHYYESMDEIRKAAVELGIEKYNAYMNDGMNTEIPFKGVGRAYIKFAQDEPELFRMFFMSPTSEIEGLPEVDRNAALAANFASEILNGDKNAGERLLFEMWIFVHGIATLSVTGKKRFTDEEIDGLSSSVFKKLKGEIS